MRVAVFSTKPYDRRSLDAANAAAGSPHDLRYLEPRLDAATAALAEGASAVCAFVNDTLDAQTIDILAAKGVRAIALRAAGFNNVDLAAAKTHALTVVRVPAYSPHAVAEHAVALLLALNRNLHRAYNRVREGNFALDGLLGFDLHGKTVGVVGTGRIGAVACRILHGFGCRVFAFDQHRNPDCEALGARYTDLPELFAESDVVTLHCPLTPDTFHLINEEAITAMKRGVLIINTSRGALVDARAAISGLKSGHLGGLGLDVYEEEADLFFEDRSDRAIADDTFARLLTFPNVIITGHQAFFTREALHRIAEVTIANLTAIEQGVACPNTVPLA